MGNLFTAHRESNNGSREGDIEKNPAAIGESQLRTVHIRIAVDRVDDSGTPTTYFKLKNSVKLRKLLDTYNERRNCSFTKLGEGDTELDLDCNLFELGLEDRMVLTVY